NEVGAIWARLAALERRLGQLDLHGQVRADGPEIPEYDPAQPPPESEEEEPAESKSWSAWQATGRPNSPTAVDATTAWAPRGQDDGPEWLRVGFAQTVE